MDEDVEAVGGGVRAHRGRGLRIGEICLQQLRRAARRVDRRLGPQRLVVAAREVEQDVRAGGGQAAGDDRPDPAGAAGDERPLAAKVERIHYLPAGFANTAGSTGALICTSLNFSVVTWFQVA